MHALAQVGAGGLAGLGGRGGDVDDVVGDLERDPHRVTEPAQPHDLLARRTGVLASELGGGGDERPGLLPDHPQVVLGGVLVAATDAGTDGLAHLPGDEFGEGLGDELDGGRTEVGQQHGGVGEEEVAGEDRGGVVPPAVGGLDAAAHAGLVHDVVVVQGGEVDHLADDGGLDQALVVGLGPDLAGEEGHDRPETFAAGGDEVECDLGEEVLAALESTDQQFLDLVESPSKGCGEVCVTDVHAGHHVVRRRVRGAGRH